MNSAFFEFNVATSALFAAKNGLSVTSNNIANSATKGYSRQVALQRASIPLPGVNGKGMVGTGTEVYGVGQIRDFYLDKKYWSEQAVLGEYDVKNTQLDIMETVFNELSTTGISSSVGDFFESLSSLTFDSGDKTYRTSVINLASAFADNINSYANSLKTQQRDINEEVEAVVQKINSIGDQIVSLNKQIYSDELDGSHANDLRDQRALLVDELSGYVNTEVRTIDSEHGEKFVVLINGQDFVNHYDNNKLKCVKREDDNKLDPDDSLGLYDLEWGTSHIPFSKNGLSGQLRGLLDIRDGNDGKNGSPDYKGIPYYIDKMNTLVQTIARAFNEGKYADGTDIKGLDGHINGYDSKGDKGGLFFTYRTEGGTFEDTENMDYGNITAFNFSISDILAGDSSKLAASSSNSSAEASNNEIVLQFAALKDNDALFKQGNVFDYVNGLCTELAIDKKQATNFDEFYTELTSGTDNQRISVSGVSLNEELTAMIKYQQLYQAAAQLVNAINQVYNTTINQLGL